MKRREKTPQEKPGRDKKVDSKSGKNATKPQIRINLEKVKCRRECTHSRERRLNKGKLQEHVSKRGQGRKKRRGESLERIRNF